MTRSRKIHRRAATTGNIELIAASQAKHVKIVVMGAGSTGKTGIFLALRVTINLKLFSEKLYGLVS